MDTITKYLELAGVVLTYVLLSQVAMWLVQWGGKLGERWVHGRNKDDDFKL